MPLCSHDSEHASISNLHKPTIQRLGKENRYILCITARIAAYMRTSANDALGILLALFADVRNPPNVRNPITLPSLGDRIKRRRLELGMSMRALAQTAKLKSVAFVADVERGFRNPSPEVLRDLALALELPLDELRGLDRRAPVQEIRAITERNPAWAAAFRRVVDAAETGAVTPDELVKLIDKQLAEKPKEGLLNLR